MNNTYLNYQFNIEQLLFQLVGFSIYKEDKQLKPKFIWINTPEAEVIW